MIKKSVEYKNKTAKEKQKDLKSAMSFDDDISKEGRKSR